MENEVKGGSRTKARPRFRDFGLKIGTLPLGPQNAITDVPGVLVGHTTIISGQGALVPGQGPVRTGVTAVRPHPGNLFEQKLPGAVYVLNGFGKATGIAQVQELGTIETPILLTNTLSVGRAWDALCEYMLRQNPEIGVTTGTVNPLVLECNDGYLNDIRGRHVKHEHVFSALDNAVIGPVPEGNVGGGTGMSCLGFKGGMGTASRCVETSGGVWAVGVLVMTNFGRMEELLVSGFPLGLKLKKELEVQPQPNLPQGSVVVVLGTNAPVSDRQLLRMAKRCGGGLARTGSRFSNGSGDFVVAFSTANQVGHQGLSPFVTGKRLRDDSRELGHIFTASAEATEEAVLNSLFAAETMVGRDGHVRMALPVKKVVQFLKEGQVLT